MHEFPYSFTPIQPSRFHIGAKISYKEIYPDPLFSPKIYCYWELKSQQPLIESFSYRVVADGCMDILWEVNTPHIPYVVGYSDSFTLFPLGTSFHYFGIRFLPTAFPLWFGKNASELLNRFEELDSIVPRISNLLSQKTEAISDLKQLKNQLDSFFLAYSGKCSAKMDPRMAYAMQEIFRHHGTLSTTQDLDVGLSPRQLRRVFQQYIGDSPKSFCKVVRFQSLLRAKPSRESLRKNKLFFDLGYYDQAHFIKEFKRMYGESPALAFS